MMGMKKLSKFRIVGIIIAVMVVVLIYELAISKYGLTCTYYEISNANVSAPIRIVQLSDLHNSEFGKENRRLVSMVAEQTPDLILITGDLLDSGYNNTDIAVNLIKDLSEIAPVYFAYGNHEREYEDIYDENITTLFREAGAAVLEYSYEDIEIDGQLLRLGGIYGYCVPPSIIEGSKDEVNFVNEFQDTDRYTILLCHMPYSWIVDAGISEWNVDLVFAGHLHGGQIRIPGIGGLWAPDQGWFPGNVAGLYSSNDNTKFLVLSRGLGSTEVIPRFNNVPEIVVVDLLS